MGGRALLTRTHRAYLFAWHATIRADLRISTGAPRLSHGVEDHRRGRELSDFHWITVS